MKQNLWRVRCTKFLITEFFPLSFKLHSYTSLSLTCRLSLQQPAAEHARCMMIPLDSIAAPLLSVQDYPFPSEWNFTHPSSGKLYYLKIRVIVFDKYTHDKKIWIIWNKLYSFHTHEHFQFCKSCQDVLLPSVLCLTTYECVSRT